MKNLARPFALAAAFTLLATYAAPAGVLYVNPNGVSPIPPFVTWTTAATNIQDAIDASTNGDVVIVTNGVYQTGARVVPGATLPNRILVDKAITVQSVNGPGVTLIKGDQNFPSPVRCAFLTNGATLAGFTLTNGATPLSPNPSNSDGYGGGVWCASTNETLANCTIINCYAALGGGGASGGTLNRCLFFADLTDNMGGGASSSLLNNCTLTLNYAANGGGGAIQGTLNNCLVISNYVPPWILGPSFNPTYGGGSFLATLNNCVVTGNSGGVGGGIVGGAANNCIVYYNDGTFNGTNTVDDNYFLAATNIMNYCCTSPLPTNGTGNITNAPLFVDQFGGNLRLQTASPCINAGNNAYVSNSTDLAGNPRIVGSAVDMGAYEFQGILHYADAASANPVAPFTSWPTAATNIQDAVDAAVNGDAVIVTNGVYQTGGRIVLSPVSNRVAVTLPMTVQSVNGAALTTIQAYPTPGVTNGLMRGVYLGNGSTLIGFTVANGSVVAPDGNSQGGGILCASTNATILNCVVTGCFSSLQGGGAWQGTLINCILSNNAAAGGGGGYGSVLSNCVVTGNSATQSGGGGIVVTFYNCLIRGNTAGTVGGGAAFSGLRNCTVVGNSAATNGGGIYLSGNDIGPRVDNCIIISNTAPAGSNQVHAVSGNFNYCCSLPLIADGTNNFTNAPLFVDQANGDFRLQFNSPCINAGSNLYAPAGLDLAGNPRIAGGTVDVGAYEFPSPTSVLSYQWAQQFGLPTDGSVDYADTDNDGANNWSEWRAGTNPTNASSRLLLANPARSNANLVITWQSVTNRSYYIQRASNLLAQPAFLPLVTNILGKPGTTSYTNTNAVNLGPFYYRVGVQ